MIEKDLASSVARLLEVNRQKKLLDEEAKDLGAVILATLDEEHLTSWHDDFLKAVVVEQGGRESADLGALKAAGLERFIKRGGAFRYVLAGRV